MLHRAAGTKMMMDSFKRMVQNLSAFSLMLFISSNTLGQKADHVLLISIDGFRPEFYLDSSWDTPNLQYLRKHGVHAKGVQSVFPSVTYPAHTTIITGAYPARHGITFNVPRNARRGEWFWDEAYIKMPTLWDAIRVAGKKSGAVMWPVTVGAPIDYNFPVRRADDDQSGNQMDVTKPFVTPARLIEDMEAGSVGKLDSSHFDANNSIDVTIEKMGEFILEKYRPSLLALHFITVDHIQHDHGRNANEVRIGIRRIDSLIGLLLAKIKQLNLDQKIALIITGDHGFTDSEKSFAPNVILKQHGLYRGKDSLAFHAAGGSAFLYGRRGVPDSTVAGIKRLFNLISGEEKAAFRFIEKNELDRIGADPQARLAISMSVGFVANNMADGALMRKKKPGGSHGYFPENPEMQTGFVAYGKGISSRGIIEDMRINDIAPLISTLLGLSFESPDGRLVPGILSR